jgi:hypothetical protein
MTTDLAAFVLTPSSRTLPVANDQRDAEQGFDRSETSIHPKVTSPHCNVSKLTCTLQEAHSSFVYTDL